MSRGIFGVFMSAVLATAGMSVAQDRSATVPSDSYTWRSVTMKANGFIDGIVFHPGQKGLIYIHTDMGGAYRYDVDAKRWVCLTDWVAYDDWSLNQMGVETLAVDPTDPNRVYFGFGTYMGPSAVIRSADQGRTWERTNVPFGMDGNGSARNAGERLMVDPNMPQSLLYGTRNKGLWKSEDYGATWNKLESFPAVGDAEGPAKNAGITWVLFDRSSGKPGSATPTIYAGVMTRGATKVFRSADAGKTWSGVASQPGGDLLPTRAAITPDGNTLYLTYVIGEGYPGPHGVIGGAVYKAEGLKGGTPTWTDISPSKGRFGWSGISLDPQDPQSLLVSVLNRYNPTDDIYRSRDGGKTWRGLNVNANRDDSPAPYAKHMGTHWVGDVQIDPNNADRAMYTTGYGLYLTENARAEEPKWVFFNEGFEQAAVLEFVSPPSGSANLLSVIGDRDGYRHEDFNVSPPRGHFGAEQKRTMGSTNDLDIAWSDPNVVVRAGGRLQYSMDGGVTWEELASAPARPSTTGPAPRGWRGAGDVALASDGSRLINSSAAGLFYAERAGSGWGEWKKSDTGPAGMRIISDYVNPKRFYAQNGRGVFASEDGGETWTQQANLTDININWMRAAIGQEGHLWASSREQGKRKGLFRSTDGGKTWNAVAPETVTVARTLGIGAPAPGQSYPAVFVGGTVGGQKGFFRSDDEGKTWVRINDDQHQYGNVIVIQGDSRVHGRLYVGTNGRGILYGEKN